MAPDPAQPGARARRRPLRKAAALACALLAPAAAGTGADSPPAAAERQAAEAIRDETLRAHTRFLADDLLEGRAPGSRGDRLAQRYIAARLESLGLEPGAPGGGWLQPVPLAGITTRAPETIAFRKGDAELVLRRREDFMAVGGGALPAAALRRAPVVFAGYGIVAAEYAWDDFKDADLRGKVLLILNNDPAGDPKLFAGDTRLYYGRWDYKYETAARKGAAAAFIIHTTESAGYPWQVVQTSWSGERFELKNEPAPELAVEGWLTQEAARRLARLGGADLDALVAAAQGRGFRPVDLGVELSLEVACDIRPVESANVLGLLRGSHPERRREIVLYTAHHDHLGISPEGVGKETDRIFNGAVDNAAGVAALLALAEAHARLESRPPRSVLFAAVAAEEQGLLGSRHLATHPPVPAGYLAAVLNIDGINIWGRTRDVTAIGMGKSSLDRLVEAAASDQGRVVKPDQFPDRGFYYRSDQFSFARIGVPGIYLDSGTEFIGRPPGWGKETIEAWEKTHYHQPSDELRDDWDLAGAVEDTRLLFHAGLRAAGEEALPAWTPGDEFEAARKAALEARR